MKQYGFFLALGLMMIGCMSSCFHHRHNTSVTVFDDEVEYKMEASYRKQYARDVQVYLNERLLNNSNASIQKGFAESDITLDDKTTFHINCSPGEVNITMNKNENSEESCERVKQVCKELEQILTHH